MADTDDYHGEPERVTFSIGITKFVSQSKSVSERECVSFAQRFSESVSVMKDAVTYTDRRGY